MAGIKEDKKQQAKDKRRYLTYGVTKEDYESILKDQNSVCGCCGELPGTGRLCIDHIHVAGFRKMEPEEKRKYVRGLVCFLCNVGFKTFDRTKDGAKNRQRLDGTFKYFQRYRLKGEL